MGTKDFFKNQTGLTPATKGAVKDNLKDSLVDVESPAHTKEIFEEKRYLLPDIDYSDPANFVRYGLATDYYNNSFERIQKQYPYDGSAAEKLNFYNGLTPLEKYIFNEKYPKFNGFVSLGQGDWGTGGSVDFSSTTIPQYIRFFGGPHEGNVIDSDVNQGNNLHIDLRDGYTIEFWLKKDGAANAGTETPKESLVNIRNESDTQKFYLYIDNEVSQQRIYFHQENYYGGAYETINTGFFDLGSITVSDGVWRHYAFTFKKGVGDTVASKCYINGQQANTVNYTLGGSVTPNYGISGSVAGTINGAGGSNIGAAPTTGDDMVDIAGNGKAKTTSYDDFRIWKAERTPKQIGLNWFRNVDGGTNTDTSKYFSKTVVDENKVDLAVYFKFNEGIISSTGAGAYAPGNEVSSSTAIGDNLIVDYSGRINNGVFIGYDSTLSMRSTGSAMILSGYAASEEKDPLLFTENSAYNTALSPLRVSGSIHDLDNRTALYNNIPQWIIDDDAKSGNELKKLLQIIGSYFDTIHSQIEHVKKFREAKYISSTNKTTDYISSLLKAHGFDVPELFVDPDVLSSIFDQDEKRIFEEKLYNLKNKIYKNIYTNLVSIYKSKGTEKGFRNLFRCYGTDDELFKINLYADGVEYRIDDKTYDTLVKKRLVDFSGFRGSSDRDAVIYQGTTDAPENYGFFQSSSVVSIPMTVEAQIVFPNKPDIASLASLPLLDTASLFGVHSSSLDHATPTIPTADALTGTGHGDCDFQVQTRRDSDGFAQFVLTSATGFFPTLTSSYFYDEEKLVYDDIPWNIAVRIYPEEKPFSDFIKQSTNPLSPTRANDNYILNFYGVKTYLGDTLAEFDVSSTITHATASQFLTGSNKRFFIGADRANFTGGINFKSDVKFSRFMVWNSYVSNEEIKKHARNPKNHGLLNPYESAYKFESQIISSSYIPKAETLALNWEFDTLKTSTDSVFDSTSGSVSDTTKYEVENFGQHNNRHHMGILHGFSSDRDSTVFDLSQADVIQRPDSLYGKNTVRIRANDYNAHDTNKKPVKMFFAFEASQNEIISREILNFFSDVVSFNNLYGAQVHQYRDKYKQLEHFKRFYFSKLEDVADIDKFVNLYKFLDNALDSVIKNLVPASAATSEKIRTVIEDHVLDRHKHKKPYPLLIQDFVEEDANQLDRFPETDKDKRNKIDDLNTIHIVPTNVKELNITSRTLESVPAGGASISNTSIRGTLSRDREAGIGFSEQAQERINSELSRTSEVLRTVDGHTNTNLATGPYGYKLLNQERDRGELVGNEDVDTFRVQVTRNQKASLGVAASKPYALSAVNKPVLGIEERRGTDFLSNKGADTASDGFKISVLPYPTTEPLLSGDLTDTAEYGQRELSVRVDARDTESEFAGLHIGTENLPEDIRVYSANTDLYGLASETNFEIDFIRHDASLGSTGKVAKGAQLLKTSTDRKEKFSVSLTKNSVTDEPEIFVTSPQVVATDAAVFGFNDTKPTNLTTERKSTYVVGPEADYNWSGKSLDLVGFGVSDDDITTTLENPAALSYETHRSGRIRSDFRSTIATVDRAAISRSVNDDDNTFYRSIDRGIFRDRTDIESEQRSPNANLNYKNLNQRRDLSKAYSTPLMNSGPYYRNLGDDIGVSVHNVPPNPRFVIEPTHNSSYDIEYDNGYIQRISQNNYDQRWYRKSNIVRLSEFNNAPFINTEFFDDFTGLVGKLIDYAPLGSSSYDSREVFTLPRSEHVFLTNTFGRQRADFAGLNLTSNRNLSVNERSINPVANDYVNERIPLVNIGEHLRLHLYLVNSTGPHSYSLNANRLQHAQSLIRHPFYKLNYTIQNTEQVDKDGITRFDIGPINSKARLNNVVVQTPEGALVKTSYEIFYPSMTEYYDEVRRDFRKMPRKLVRPILESEENSKYKTIFSDEGKRLNGHTVKYFDFAEQVYPRRQLNVQWLDHYETDTDFFLAENDRKTNTFTTSLGTVMNTRIANFTSVGFSSWPTETFPITSDSGKSTVNDGELMQPNTRDSYQKLGHAQSPFNETDGSDPDGDFVRGYRIQTYGYRINHRNRPDSSLPTRVPAKIDEELTPYRRYETLVAEAVGEHPNMGVVAEYRSVLSMDEFLQGGCEQLSSEPTIFGLSFFEEGAYPTEKVLGHASYSDEIFQLKDIHKQIDKF